MNIHSIRGALNIAKGRLKQKLANLTGDKFQLIEGKQDEQMGRLQKCARERRKEADKMALESPVDGP